jgi:molybdopterin-containing oxidoreductase family iron-sulfur binding subunit
MDLDAIWQRLSATDGPQYWRTLEELADTPEFRERIEAEFAPGACDWTDPVSRRRFLALMGASLALAGVAGCSARPAPHEKIMPYVRQPEELIPGRPLFYATAMPLVGSAIGLLVESHEGRPTKVEGNPEHPASLGATDVFAQASVLTLYDPDRSKNITYRGRPRAWSEALAALRGGLDQLRDGKGAGLRLLTETVTSPSLAGLITQLLKEFPEAHWVQWEPAARDNAYEGARLAFGTEADHAARYDFTKADVIVSLDADFLLWGPGRLRYAREFVERRRVRVGPGTPEEQKAGAGKATMNRLYVVECAPSITGAKADHRLPRRAHDVDNVARALAAALGVPGVQGRVKDEAARWVDALAEDLRDRGPGKSLVLAGDGQPPAVHALAHALNERLGNFGKTVYFGRPPEARPTNQTRELEKLVEDMENGQVQMLAVLGGNPAFTAPADLKFQLALEKMKGLRVHLGLYQDETAVRCDWHVPEAHFLEMWGDARAFDGTASLIQPLIEPLYGGRSVYELLAAFTEYPERTGYDIVRAHWRAYHGRHGRGDFERFWVEALRRGTVPDLAKEFAPASRPPTVRADWAKGLAGPPPAGDLEIVFKPDPSVFDGRFANNGWLQELPQPITRLTWGNAALLGVNTFKQYHLHQSYGWTGGERGRVWADKIKLTYDGRHLELPAFAVPGHAENSVTVHIGHGRERAGRVGDGVGANAYALRTSAPAWFGGGVALDRLPERTDLACVQGHHLLHPNSREQEQIDIREPVHHATLDEFRKDSRFSHTMVAGKAEEPEVRSLVPGYDDQGPEHTPKPGELEKEQGHDQGQDRRLVPLSLYPQDTEPKKGYDGYRWGMAIDLTACIGCNACVIACQAENNIPVVGKMEVTRGREMHWLRIDTYFYKRPGDPDPVANPPTYFQPVPCMHCEKAPCELVCPVEATAHSHDGLNDMVYNRCVGTRYCSNNCPYKVRRFNFLEYADYATESLKLLRNPDVTVRSRGVMEKCTYCVQRIRAADIAAQRRLVEARAAGGSPDDEAIDRANRVGDGEVVTACQAACPAHAIVFGDLNGPGRDRAAGSHSEVYHWKQEPLNYALLAGLNTQPRTTYLAALSNPNPKLS